MAFFVDDDGIKFHSDGFFLTPTRTPFLFLKSRYSSCFRAPPLPTSTRVGDNIDDVDCHLLRGVHAQATICEYTITHADVIFSTDDDDDSGVLSATENANTVVGKSFLIS